MEKLNAYPVYLVGAHLGPLYTVVQLPKITLAQITRFAFNAQDILNKFLRDIIIPVRGSKDKAKELLSVLDKLLTEDRLKVPDQPLSQKEVNEIWTFIRDFEAIFESECNHLDVYFITPKRGGDMSVLMN